MDPKAERKLKELLKRAIQLNIDIAKLPILKKYPTIKLYSYKQYSCFIIFTVAILFIVTYLLTVSLLHRADDECYIDMPVMMSNAFRSPQSCDFCVNIKEIVRLSDIQPDVFERIYAYSAAPIIATDATVNWTALNVCPEPKLGYIIVFADEF